MKNNNVVEYKNDSFHLNTMLIKEQKISDKELEEIKILHIQRLKIEESFILGLLNAEDYQEAWELNQFYLQDAWKFPRNKNFHSFWSMKGCSCSSSKNRMNYPNGNYSYSPTCKVHGK